MLTCFSWIATLRKSKFDLLPSAFQTLDWLRRPTDWPTWFRTEDSSFSVCTFGLLTLPPQTFWIPPLGDDVATNVLWDRWRGWTEFLKNEATLLPLFSLLYFVIVHLCFSFVQTWVLFALPWHVSAELLPSSEVSLCGVGLVFFSSCYAVVTVTPLLACPGRCSRCERAHWPPWSNAGVCLLCSWFWPSPTFILLLLFVLCASFSHSFPSSFLTVLMLLPVSQIFVSLHDWPAILYLLVLLLCRWGALVVLYVVRLVCWRCILVCGSLVAFSDPSDVRQCHCSPVLHLVCGFLSGPQLIFFPLDLSCSFVHYHCGYCVFSISCVCFSPTTLSYKCVISVVSLWNILTLDSLFCGISCGILFQSLTLPRPGSWSPGHKV